MSRSAINIVKYWKLTEFQKPISEPSFNSSRSVILSQNDRTFVCLLFELFEELVRARDLIFCMRVRNGVSRKNSENLRKILFICCCLHDI